jgi:hypothetical protein
MKRRSHTISRKEIRRQMRRERIEGVVDLDLERTIRELDAAAPRCRSECSGIPRPCPFFRCRFNLYLDVNPATGSVKFNFPGKDLEDLAETCALDVADRGGITLEEVGGLMAITRERVRQIETSGILVLRAFAENEPRAAR